MTESQSEDTPTLRQRLHSATGDREAEGKALADRADDAVDEDAATKAVRRAHGDIDPEAAAHRDEAAKPKLATPAEAAAARNDD